MTPLDRTLEELKVAVEKDALYDLLEKAQEEVFDAEEKLCMAQKTLQLVSRQLDRFAEKHPNIRDTSFLKKLLNVEAENALRENATVQKPSCERD